MKSRRVLILFSHSLFAEGISSTLEKEKAVEVVGTCPVGPKALASIRTLRPDAVIIEENGPDIYGTLDLFRIFTEKPGLRVIRVSLQDNGIAVYDSRWITAAKLTDLISVITSNL